MENLATALDVDMQTLLHDMLLRLREDQSTPRIILATLKVGSRRVLVSAKLQISTTGHSICAVRVLDPYNLRNLPNNTYSKFEKVIRLFKHLASSPNCCLFSAIVVSHSSSNQTLSVLPDGPSRDDNLEDGDFLIMLYAKAETGQILPDGLDIEEEEARINRLLSGAADVDTSSFDAIIWSQHFVCIFACGGNSNTKDARYNHYPTCPAVKKLLHNSTPPHTGNCPLLDTGLVGTSIVDHSCLKHFADLLSFIDHFERRHGTELYGDGIWQCHRCRIALPTAFLLLAHMSSNKHIPAEEQSG